MHENGKIEDLLLNRCLLTVVRKNFPCDCSQANQLLVWHIIIATTARLSQPHHPANNGRSMCDIITVNTNAVHRAHETIVNKSDKRVVSCSCLIMCVSYRLVEASRVIHLVVSLFAFMASRLMAAKCSIKGPAKEKIWLKPQWSVKDFG